MKKKETFDYDVIIVGSGISGLTCAGYLTTYGKRVLVLEQDSQVGGYFAGFWKNGYYFDAGVRAFESSGLVLPMFEHLGIRDKIELEKSKVVFVFPDTTLEMNDFEGIDAYFSWLTSKFPEDAEGLKKIHDYSSQISDLLTSLAGMSASLFKPSLKSFFMIPVTLFHTLQFLNKLRKIRFLFSIPFMDILEKNLHNRNLINIISQKFFVGTPGYFGLGYIQMFMDYYYPAGGISSVTNALKKMIETKGGVVLCNKRVDEIIVEKKKARGVILRDGTRISAKAVVHAGDGKWLYEKMLPETAANPKTVENVKNATPCESNFSVFLGLDIPPEDLPFQGCHHVFYTPDYTGTTFEDRYTNMDYFKHVIQEISVPALVSKSLAPEGKSGVELSAVAVPEFADNWKRTKESSTAEYEALKTKCADDMIDNLEKIIPGVRNRIECIEVGTPYTNERITMNSGGSITGWTLEKEKSFKVGILSGKFSFYKKPLKNLYHIGHWAFAPGGVPTCVLGAKLAAGKLKKI